jgi:predicted ATPase
MINRIQVLHYKALKYVDINLSEFLILIGPNASGKSTLFDVIDLLRDVLKDGPNRAVEKRVPDFRDLLWKKQGHGFEVAVELKVPEELKEISKEEFSNIRYEISINLDERKGIFIGGENLWLIKKGSRLNINKSMVNPSLFPSEKEEPKSLLTTKLKGWVKTVSKTNQGNDYFRSESTGWNNNFKFGPLKSSLAGVPEDNEKFPISLWVKRSLLDGIQFLKLNSESMRLPCRPDLSVDFQVDGSNLPKVVQFLKKGKPESFKRWIKHIQTALPEIENIEVKEKIEDRFLYLNLMHKNNVELPSWVISDGTLRLLAQTIIAYLPNNDKIYLIEEPENGLHPLAIESVFQSLSSVYDHQVMLASHSPIFLKLAQPQNILCFSKLESGAVDIINGKNHPKLIDWRKGTDLSLLHAAGVLQ